MTDQTTRPFSWLGFLGGLIVTLFVGAFLNVAVGLAAAAFGSAALGVIIGALPGVGFAFFLARNKGLPAAFATGMLVGGCIVALIGGACGAMMGHG